MKKYSAQDILDGYINFGAIDVETMKSGDYKTANREYKKVINIYKYLENNIELASETLPILFKNENVSVRTNAASDCLALNIHIKEAEKILEKDSNNKDNGLYRSNAELTLKAWRKQGYLKIYQTKEDKKNHLKK